MNQEIYKRKSKKTFDETAEIYDNTSNGKHSSKLYSTVVKEIESDKYNFLLDVGCGTGNVLAKLSPEKDFYGIDLSDQMIAVAQKRLPHIKFVVGDSSDLPWDNSVFDVVNCTDSFHHYPEPTKVLNEMHRVLKNKGRLVITDPYYPLVIRFFINTFARFGDSGDVRIYSQKEITALLKNTGFSNVNFRVLKSKSFIVTAEAA